MTPKKLVLHHYCQHEHKEFVFARGMNSIVGPNGSGKSTLIDALRLCLCLESGNPGKTSDNIQDGYDQSRLELVFEHDGHDGSIHVTLKRNYTRNWEETSLSQELARAKVAAREHDPTVRVSESEVQLSRLVPREQMVVELRHNQARLTKVTEIREWMRLATGLEVKTLAGSYFPRQGDVDGALSGDRETRQQVFHEKAGTSLCQKICDELAKEIRGIPDLTAVIERRDDLRLRAARAQADASDARDKANEAAAQVRSPAGAQEILERCRISTEQAQRRAEMLARRGELAREVAELESAVTRLLHDGSRDLALVQSLSGAAEEAQVLLDSQAEISARKDERGRLEREIARAESELGRVVDPEKPQSPEPHALALQQIRRSMQEGKEFLSKFRTGVCPTCHQEVANAVARVESLERMLPDLERSASQEDKAYRELVARGKEYEKAAQEAAARRASLRSSIQSCHASLDRAEDLGPLAPPDQLARARDAVHRHASAQETLGRTSARYEASRKDLEIKKGILAGLDAQISACLVQEIPSEADVQAAHQEVIRHQEMSQFARELDTEAQVRTRYLADVKADLAAVESQAAQLEPQERLRAVLSSIRDLLHRDALPAEVVAWYADQLVLHTMTYLKMFESEFELFVAQDLSLMASFAHKVLPVSRLSGGQKNMLNISMRLAMVDMFPSELRLLVLDEVEVHLDQQNVAKLPIVLERVKGLAMGRDLVVLFVSHHPSLSGVADHVLAVSGP